MLVNKLVRIGVGTDLSRPLGLFNRRQGRDKSVPTTRGYIAHKKDSNYVFA